MIDTILFFITEEKPRFPVTTSICICVFLPESLQIAADFGEVSGRQIGVCPKDVDEQLVLGRGVQLVELGGVGLR